MYMVILVIYTGILDNMVAFLQGRTLSDILEHHALPLELLLFFYFYYITF